MNIHEVTASSMDSFIVRVYRVDRGDHRRIVGTVEPVDGSGDQEVFTSMDELGDILHQRASQSIKRGRMRALPENG